ncbi:RNA pol II accessory factor, Cdc73 family, C-terminal [Teratosphaeria destructans]|uniref:RNA pol II accessory factor, Cdc73 family, C-terminal n=1 Tax=Teratosphaeria destructans TaxID=418781 RepID=A0A9W7SPW0_9PEZI|nr:RNA pol II accessory factor, Cdc73 family, C-terminal [Teratosphaeria destructans]
MAAAEGLPDALSLLRAIITTGQSLPIPSSTSDASTATDTQVSLAAASYLIFNAQNAHTAIPLTQPTRFISTAAGNKPFDLRTVYFVWQIRDKNAGQVISETAALNQELQALGKHGEQVPNTAFLERVDLNDWLDGKTGESESEFIQPLDGGKTTRREAADAAGVASGDVEMRDADDVGGKGEQERLREIYAAERKLGDRNLVLRGVKVQDFSDVRKKYSMLFFAKARQQQNGAAPPLNSNPALRPPVKQTAPGRRPEPIILLSPSASSLLRMPNIKSFLEEGIYTTPDTGSSANLLHLTRTLPSISPQKPIRFILVDDPSSFRPDYWDRLVAVFTTGQTWQFKNYKWQQPAELFSHALGIYVGWKGEVIPDTVRGWGRGVMVAQIDKGGARWRDKEVVEELWRGIEARMKGMGWGKEQR